MYITGGGNGDSYPDPKGEDVVLSSQIAMATGTVTTALFQIPNQCITFTSDPIQKCRSEDSIIAFTWDHYLKDPSDPTWLVRFPMVKASVRAMDATAAFMKTKFPGEGFDLDSFIVSGASKRGWTTWLVGAVDPVRVKVFCIPEFIYKVFVFLFMIRPTSFPQAIVPIVLDAINFVAVEHHQYRSYGGWSFALQDYWELNITARFDDPNMKKLCELEDPYYYASRCIICIYIALYIC
jgi:PhoPQ-activated pathogenicity-related protein